MASSAIFISFFLSLSLHVSAKNPDHICPVRVCNPLGPEIRFPFRASDFRHKRCGYPGFDLSCNIQGQAILQLPSSQDFVVDLIDYENQYVVLKDPSNCLAKRLRSLTLSGSVFVAQEYGYFTFANCSGNLSVFGNERVGCLSDGHRTVVVAPSGSFSWYFSRFQCRTKLVLVPVAQRYPTDITESVVLKWDMPDCRSCEKTGGRCGFKGSAGFDVGCFGKHGLSKHAKLGIILGVPSLLCMSGLAFYLSSRAQLSGHRDPRDQPPNGSNGENNIANITSPSSPSRETRRASDGVTGINLATIESYPTIQVDDDGQVLRFDDSKQMKVNYHVDCRGTW
ncbi:hypothetical protein NL676_010034 [Syzygium grande]|nr:hypothetical protein NL676_010034 [Syzygium grande]